MNCNTCEQHILLCEASGQPLPHDAQKHLESCGACRAFRAAQNALNEADLVAVPPALLDDAILKAARQRRPQDRRARHGWQVLPRLAAVAAALAVAAMITVVALRLGDTPSGGVAIAPPEPSVLEWDGGGSLEVELAAMEANLSLFLAGADHAVTAPRDATARLDDASLELLIHQLDAEMSFEDEALAL